MEHYFRHEYGRLVAILVRRVGLPHLEAVEDAVQGALLAALTAWVGCVRCRRVALRGGV